MNNGLILQAGVTEIINRYSPIELNNTEVVLLFVLLILFILLAWVLFMHFKTKINSDSRIQPNRRKQNPHTHSTSNSNKPGRSQVKKLQETNPPVAERKETGKRENIVEESKRYLGELEDDDLLFSRYDIEDKKNVDDEFTETGFKINEEAVDYTETKKPEKKDKTTSFSPPKKSAPIEDSRENKSELDEILHIGYEPSNKFSQGVDWSYPVVKMPDSGSVIRQPSHRRQHVRGYKERSFQITLEKAFQKEFDVLGDCVISTGPETRPFEPDIVLRRLKDKRNIFIDIEIDEPYGGISRSSTHIKEDDDYRDIYFNDRGWIVIRFAEIQVHQEPKKCVAHIFKVIKEIAPEINLPATILNIDDPQTVEQWDQLQAERWAKERYREVYLKHDFDPTPDEQSGDTAIEFSELDEKTEELVNPTKYVTETPEPIKGKVNPTNIHPRDERIQFFPKKHLYLVDGVPAKAVSEIVDKFFPKFDKIAGAKKKAKKLETTVEKILAEFDAARDAGTYLHTQIENYFNGEEFDTPPAFKYFLNFINKHSHLNTYRTEWRVFDEKKLIAGTIDYVAKNSDGTYSIYDWKRSKNIVDEYNGGYGPQRTHPFGKGFGALNNVDSTSFNKYCLQQGIYKRLLEKNYQIAIRDMYLVVLHPRYSDYYKYPVDEYDEEVEYILKNI